MVYNVYLGPIIHYENPEKLFFISTFDSQEELTQAKSNLGKVHGTGSKPASVTLLLVLILDTLKSI